MDLSVRYFQHEKRPQIRSSLLDSLFWIVYRFRHANETTFFNTVLPFFKKKDLYTHDLDFKVSQRSICFLIYSSCRITMESHFTAILSIFESLTLSLSVTAPLRCVVVRGLGVVFSHKLFGHQDSHAKRAFSLILRVLTHSTLPSVQRECLLILSKIGSRDTISETTTSSFCLSDSFTVTSEVTWNGHGSSSLLWRKTEFIPERMSLDSSSASASSTSSNAPTDPSSNATSISSVPAASATTSCSSCAAEGCEVTLLSFNFLFSALLKSFSSSGSTFECFQLASRCLLYYARETSLLSASHLSTLLEVVWKGIKERFMPWRKEIFSEWKGVSHANQNDEDGSEPRHLGMGLFFSLNHRYFFLILSLSLPKSQKKK